LQYHHILTDGTRTPPPQSLFFFIFFSFFISAAPRLFDASYSRLSNPDCFFFF
jgi:hypothetical protein